MFTIGKHRIAAGAVLFIILSLWAFPPPTVNAAGIIVNSIADTSVAGDGACTLREAINNANADADTTSGDCTTGAGTDTITFSVSGTLALSSILPPITSDIIINGSGQAIVIDGGGSIQAIQVNPLSTLTLIQLTFQNGNANVGGAIVNNGTLNVNYCRFENNTASNSGGAIYNTPFSSLSVVGSTFVDNTVINNGGAILSATNTQTVITNSTFSDNAVTGVGGGVANDGIMVLTHVTFYSNTANTNGSALYNGLFGTTYLAGTVMANDAPVTGNCVNFGTLVFNTYNFSDDASCGFSDIGSLNNATLPFGSLNGQGVHVPSVGNDAISAIPNTYSINNNGVLMACNGSTTDQLGVLRPINVGAACTSGSVEIASGVTIIALENPMQTTEGGDTAQFTVVLNTLPTVPVVINVTSDNLAEGVISAGATLNFNAANWNIPQTVTVTGVDDFVVDGNIAYNANWVVAAGSAAEYLGFNGSVALVNLDDDILGVTITPLESPMQTTEGGDTAQFTVVLNTLPTAPVTINVTSDNLAEGVISAGATLNFNAANWNTPQTVTVTGVDDALQDGNIAYNANWVVAAGSAAEYLGFNGSVALVNLDDDILGVTITPLESPMQTTEGGDTAQFTVVLNTLPTAPVTINVTSDNLAEGVISAGATLNFNAANWNIPQTVTVTGVDDALQDGNIAYNANWVVAAGSAAEYLGFNGSVALTNLDNDTAGIAVASVNPPEVDENGPTSTNFFVVLQTQPTATVTIDITNSDGQCTVTPTLVFDTSNWSINQEVIVTAVDDPIIEGTHNCMIDLVSISVDPLYNALTVGPLSFTVFDNDVAGLVLAAVNPLEVHEQGPTTTNYFAALATQPSTDVTLVLTTADGQCTTDVPTLTFTMLNWDTFQTVNVTAVDDTVIEGNHTCVVNNTTTSADSNYDGSINQDLIFTVFDNDAPDIILTPSTYFTWEEGQPTTTYTIELGASPMAGETVTVDIELIPLQLTSQTPIQVLFTDVNWNVPVTITVVPLDDGIDENYTVEVITHTATSDLLGSAWQGVTANLVLTIFDTQALAFPLPFHTPNIGEILISVNQVQQPYDSAGGEPIYLPSGAPLLLPHDYDGNGFDTYVVTETKSVDGTRWFGIFIGNEIWVWVPATQVTVLR